MKRKILGNMCRSGGYEQKNVFRRGRQGIEWPGGQWSMCPVYVIDWTL
jgi:hypothetical protein